MQSKRILLAGFSAALLFSAGVCAEEADERPYPGEETRQWLALQRDGEHASTIPQRLSGPVAVEVHERFVNSFTHEIPEFFEGEIGTALTTQQ